MKKVILAAVAFAPALVFAQSLGNLEVLLKSVGRLVSLALPIVIALALLAFFWGLVGFLFGGPEKKDDAKTMMIWGVVALFVMVSVWGLVRFIGTAFNITAEDSPQAVPTVPGLRN